MGNLFRAAKIKKVCSVNETIDIVLERLCDDVSNNVKSYLEKIKYVDINLRDVVAINGIYVCDLCGKGRCGYTNHYHFGCLCLNYIWNEINKDRDKVDFNTNKQYYIQKRRNMNIEYFKKIHNIYNRINELLKHTKRVVSNYREFSSVIDGYVMGKNIRPELFIYYCSNCEMLIFSLKSNIIFYQSIDVKFIIDSFKFGSGPVTFGTLLFPLNSIENLLKDINTGYLTFTLRALTKKNYSIQHLNFKTLKEKNLTYQYY